MVTVRSYSRNSGSTDDDSETGTSGISRSASLPICRSWSEFANELISETASASMPPFRSRRSCAPIASSSSGVTTDPSEPIRSSASTVSSSGASGSGLGQMIHPASPPGTKDRAICRICRNPLVVTRPTLAPLPSRIAFVAIVVPCRIAPTWSSVMPASWQTFSMPLSTPTD